MPISPDLEKLAADSNVVLSALIGGRALRVFAEANFVIITTEFNLNEVRQYTPALSKKYRIDQEVLDIQFRLLNLKPFPKEHYSKFISQASGLMAGRDPKDADLLALALKENIPIWSNDKDYQNTGVKLLTTAELLAMF
ncbi:MAG: PIN domain-containing protein [Actinobacteria bacterium]|nr:PIN domain-containing protein [Actinomycetota bacterium]